MCIRDSFLTLHQRFSQCIRHLKPDVVSGEFVFWSDVAEACLLYTSDAADERSSVDLGGRRIIKKKKRRKS